MIKNLLEPSKCQTVPGLEREAHTHAGQSSSGYQQIAMESVAVTPGTMSVGLGVDHMHSTSTCRSSTDSLNIRLTDVSTLNLWMHQKRDFIQGTGDSQCIADEVFVFHLLQIHTKFCLDASCKCSCSNNSDDEHNAVEQSNTKTTPNDNGMSFISNKVFSNSKPSSSSNFMNASASSEEKHYLTNCSMTDKSLGAGCGSEGTVSTSSLAAQVCTDMDSCLQTSEPKDSITPVEVSGLKLEPSDMPTHDLLTYCNTSMEIKQEGVCVGGGLSEAVSSTPPEDTPDSEFDRLLEVAMESSYVQHGQERDLVAMESTDMSHAYQRDIVAMESNVPHDPVSIDTKQEKRTNEENSDEAVDARTILLPDEEPALAKMKPAKVVLQKLNIRKTLAKCVDCHKLLQGSSFQYCLDGVQHNIVMKCARCKTDGTKAAELHEQMIDPEADIQREMSTQRSLHGKRGMHSCVKSDTPDQTSGDVYSPVTSSTSLNRRESRDNPESRGRLPDTAGQVIENMPSPGTTTASPNARESRDNLENQEGVAGTCSIGIQSRTYNSKHYENLEDPSRDRISKDCDGPFECKLCSANLAEKRDLLRLKQNSGQISFHCEVCSKAFSQQQLTKHAKLHSGKRLFTCETCSKSFFSDRDLARHTRTHTGEKPFLCSTCSVGFSLKGNLTRHMRTHTGEKPFSCSTCFKHFSCRRSLTLHMRTHSGEKPFTCEICTKAFSYKSNLTVHIRMHTGDKPFKCRLCMKAFSHKSHLTRHVTIHRGDRPFKCRVCSKVFTQKWNLKAHIKKHTGERPFRCSTCSEYLSYSNNLARSVRTHTGERPFTCKLCPKAFSRNGDLVKHIRSHTGERPFTCSLCSACFSQTSTLARHMRTHSCEKNYNCKVCSRAFSLKGDLSRHIRTHTGERRFPCSSCFMSFSQKSNLVTHMRTHSGEKPFSCSTCSKRFSYRSSLTIHMRSHSGEKPFSCKVCSKAFSYKSSIIAHMKTHTGDK